MHTIITDINNIVSSYEWWINHFNNDNDTLLPYIHPPNNKHPGILDLYSISLDIKFCFNIKKNNINDIKQIEIYRLYYLKLYENIISKFNKRFDNENRFTLSSRNVESELDQFRNYNVTYIFHISRKNHKYVAKNIY